MVGGVRGAVYKYVRPSGRCPADDFLDDCVKAMLDKFRGSFSAVTKMGADYQIEQRFKPLKGYGRPLWEFKEHDHRLYCARTVMPARAVHIVLLSGWVKDKAEKKKEATKIESAKALLEEMQQLQKGGKKK